MNKRLFKTKQTIGTGIASAIALLASFPRNQKDISGFPRAKIVQDKNKQEK